MSFIERRQRSPSLILIFKIVRAFGVKLPELFVFNQIELDFVGNKLI
jgi:DNA-binding XRE family transcriptional regulator